MHIVILNIIQVLIGFAIIGLVLMQQGKGADVGAAFGSGASNTMFGSAGSTSFLMKVTMIMAALFFCTCLGLNYVGSHAAKPATPKGILNLPSSTQMATTMPATKTSPSSVKILPSVHKAMHMPQVWNHKAKSVSTASTKKSTKK